MYRARGNLTQEYGMWCPTVSNIKNVRGEKEQVWDTEAGLQKICPITIYKILSRRFGFYQCFVEVEIVSNQKYTP